MVIEIRTVIASGEGAELTGRKMRGISGGINVSVHWLYSVYSIIKTQNCTLKVCAFYFVNYALI